MRGAQRAYARAPGVHESCVSSHLAGKLTQLTGSTVHWSVHCAGPCHWTAVMVSIHNVHNAWHNGLRRTLNYRPCPCHLMLAWAFECLDVILCFILEYTDRRSANCTTGI